MSHKIYKNWSLNDLDDINSVFAHPECDGYELDEGCFEEGHYFFSNRSVYIVLINKGDGYYESHIGSIPEVRGAELKKTVLDFNEFVWKFLKDCNTLVAYIDADNRSARVNVFTLGFRNIGHYIYDNKKYFIYEKKRVE